MFSGIFFNNIIILDQKEVNIKNFIVNKIKIDLMNITNFLKTYNYKNTN